MEEGADRFVVFNHEYGWVILHAFEISRVPVGVKRDQV